ncbi:predicted protein [Lichtheimia corymbifera JMRC:FSU:9682]|uniref:Uncharacterized protein n=1 Tax=Lichtheimia corymbifera JMRC:FSU:9682 TaxID=1263082 RepID=A0A068SCM0_9FUNG|nr:predicted protein [Lichtheimia corymbifera JMRC:FSU:9682]
MSTHHLIVTRPRTRKRLVICNDGTSYIKREDTDYESFRRANREAKLLLKAAKNIKKNEKDASKTISMESKPIDSTKMDAEPKQQQQQQHPERPVK